MIVNKELWGKFDASKLKKHNPYLHQYISAVTDFDNEMHCAYIGNRKAQFHKIGVLMENVIHDMNNDEVTDILTDIVISLFGKLLLKIINSTNIKKMTNGSIALTPNIISTKGV